MDHRHIYTSARLPTWLLLSYRGFMARVVAITAVAIAIAAPAGCSRTGAEPDGLVRANQRLTAEVPTIPDATPVQRTDVAALYRSEGELAPSGSGEVEAVESAAVFTAHGRTVKR